MLIEKQNVMVYDAKMFAAPYGNVFKYKSDPSWNCHICLEQDLPFFFMVSCHNECLR